MLDKGELTQQALAWREGLSEWVSVSSLLDKLGGDNSPTQSLAAEARPDVDCIRDRIWGTLIDGVLFGLVALPIFFGIRLCWPAADFRLIVAISAVVVIPLIAFCLSSKYQATPGMILRGIALGSNKGGRVSFAHSMMRHLASFLSYFFLLGFIMGGRSQQKQTLHDVVCKTVVFRKRFSTRVKIQSLLLMGGFFAIATFMAIALLVAVRPSIVINQVRAPWIAEMLNRKRIVNSSQPTAVNGMVPQAGTSTKPSEDNQTSFTSQQSSPTSSETTDQGASQSAPDSGNSEQSTPSDPGNNLMYKKEFKIVEILSPGKALAQEILVGDAGNTHLLGDKAYLLTGIPASLVDDDSWSGWVFDGDNFTYTTTEGSQKTIRSFTVSTNQNPSNVKVTQSVKLDSDDGYAHIMQTTTAHQ